MADILVILGMVVVGIFGFSGYKAEGVGMGLFGGFVGFVLYVTLILVFGILFEVYKEVGVKMLYVLAIPATIGICTLINKCNFRIKLEKK